MLLTFPDNIVCSMFMLLTSRERLVCVERLVSRVLLELLETVDWMDVLDAREKL